MAEEKKKRTRKIRKREYRPRVSTPAMKRAQAKMKEAAALYRAYKKENPSSTKRMPQFLKQVWGK